MNAAVIQELPFQRELFGAKPIANTPTICRRIIVGSQQVKANAVETEVSANPQAAAQARAISEAKYEEMARIARTPIVPMAWLRCFPQITPDETGGRPSGRPRLNTRRSLGVGDLDQTIAYMQRRTRDVNRIVKGAQPSEEHTTKIVTAAIKDVIRKISINLPDEKRDALEEVVAKI